MKKILLLALAVIVAVLGINVLSTKTDLKKGKEGYSTSYEAEKFPSSAESKLSSPAAPAACQKATSESELWQNQSCIADEESGNVSVGEGSIKQIADQERKNGYVISKTTESLCWKAAAVTINQAICEWDIGSIITLSARHDQKELSITYVICNDTAIVSFTRSDELTAVGYYTTGEEDGVWHYIENLSGVRDTSLMNIRRLAADIHTYTAQEIVLNELLHCKIISLDKTKNAYIVTATYEYPETGIVPADEVQYKVRINAESRRLESISYIQTNSKQQPVKEGTYMAILPEDTSYYNRLIDVYSKIRSSDTILAHSLVEIMNTALEP